jgi:uncharacterized protein
MQSPFLHLQHNNHFWLTAQRCIFWEEEQTLIVSDLHFGKTGHFRKSGIAVPQTVFKEDLQRLIAAIAHFNPLQVIAVGDLFHSHANKELDLFVKWRNDFKELNFHLIKGNHDILGDAWYGKANLIVHKECYTIGSFCFVHDIATCTPQMENTFFFTGHIHPGVTLSGVGKQSLRFPCFYFTNNFAVLPAFSRFTGLAAVKQKKADTVYAIVNDSVLKV